MALEKDPNFPEALVAMVVHNVLAGKETEDVMRYVCLLNPRVVGESAGGGRGITPPGLYGGLDPYDGHLR